MAQRLDRETIVKYADKAFLGLALAFLIFSGLMLVLGEKKPKVTYSDVVRAYTQAEDEVKRFPPEGLSAKEAEELMQKKMETLLESDPTALKLFNARPDYGALFTTNHQSQPDPWLAGGRDRFAYYYSLKPQAVKTFQPVRVAQQRVAPDLLLLRQDRGYWSSDKEKDGTVGIDLFWITGQARIDLARQTVLNREAAVADENQKWDAWITTTIPVGFDVERQELQNDGTWGKWEERRTVRYEDVARRQKLPRLPVTRYRDGEAKALFKDLKAADEFKKNIRGFVANVVKYREHVLTPPFYKLAGGKEVILPFDEAGVDKPTEKVEDNVLPAAGGPEDVLPAAADDPWGARGPLAPGPERREAPRPVRRTTQKESQTEFVFNDLVTAREVGRTFRYRCRIRFMNPIFGAEMEEVDPEHLDEAWIVEVPGEWSQPSEPITIDPIVRFYFVGQSFDSANFRLFCWKYGSWHEIRSASFGIGEAITTTRQMPIEIPIEAGKPPVQLPGRHDLVFDARATVVDIVNTSMPYQGVTRRALKLVFQDQVSQKLGSRLDLADKDGITGFLNDIKKELDSRGKGPRPPEGPGRLPRGDELPGGPGPGPGPRPDYEDEMENPIPIPF